MPDTTSCLSIFLVIFAVITHQSQSTDEKDFQSESLDATQCAQLGFSKDHLLCSSCKLLTKYELEELSENCSRCCNELDTEPEQAVKKYQKARLEVCWCKFQSMPQIEAFVKSDRPKKFPNLTIKHIDGQSPIIKLINENGAVEQTMSIAKWDTDTVEEFLQTYLE